MAVELRLPRLTISMNEALVIAWLKDEGEWVEKGEDLVEVEVDKGVIAISTPASGILLRVIVREGSAVPVGGLLAFIGEAGEEVPEVIVEEVPREAKAVARAAEEGAPLSRTGKFIASPAARHLAKELGVQIEEVEGTGPSGAVVEEDVRRFAEERARTVPVSSEEYEEIISLTGFRKAMAERMALSSRTVARATTIAEVDMGGVTELRERVAATFTAFTVKAAAQAITSFRVINSCLSGERILVKRHINIGVAVDSKQGLLVPVIRDADVKSLVEIDKIIRTLNQKASEEGLSLKDMSGGTFTVSNSGVLGSLLFTPIINYPESAILGMGKVMDTPVVRSGQIVIRPMMHLCLSYDHRIIEGAYSVRFLQRVKEILEDPEALLSGKEARDGAS
jgi:pyruvate/2-oxoglutarate dehydrogenase complex dihydrolipoamide acyltransferase (E2) component